MLNSSLDLLNIAFAVCSSNIVSFSVSIADSAYKNNSGDATSQFDLHESEAALLSPGASSDSGTPSAAGARLRRTYCASLAEPRTRAQPNSDEAAFNSIINASQ